MATIILIEDERLLSELMAEQLRVKGYEIIEAADGEKGLKSIRDHKPDLILLDLMMPLLDGYEVLEALRKDNELSGIPCIVISNSGQTSDLNRAYRLGAKDVLVKADFTPDQLVEKVATLLGKPSK